MGAGEEIRKAVAYDTTNNAGLFLQGFVSAIACGRDDVWPFTGASLSANRRTAKAKGNQIKIIMTLNAYNNNDKKNSAILITLHLDFFMQAHTREQHAVLGGGARVNDTCFRKGPKSVNIADKHVMILFFCAHLKKVSHASCSKSWKKKESLKEIWG